MGFFYIHNDVAWRNAMACYVWRAADMVCCGWCAGEWCGDVMRWRAVQKGYGATSIKRFSLELGGDCPVLIFADCDLEAAVNDIVGLKYDNGGQICVSPNRVLVERSVYEKFIEMAAAKAKGYVHGSGADDGAVLQPVCSQQSLDRLVGYVDDAVAKGARKICGGAKADREGFFLEATILADTTKDMKCSCEEIFGPILTVQPFETADEAFTKANDSDMGLSGYVRLPFLFLPFVFFSFTFCVLCLNQLHIYFVFVFRQSSSFSLLSRSCSCSL